MSTWLAMAGRCHNPKDQRFTDYGGRGITVCDRWRGPDGFANFLADMGERPAGKTLDRKDNDRGYSPDNCRWATNGEQASNKRNVTLNPVAVIVMRYMRKRGAAVADLGHAFGVGMSAAGGACNGNHWPRVWDLVAASVMP